MTLLPYKEVHVLDRNAEYLGVPTYELMENAGEAVFITMEEQLKLKKSKVIVFCGTGNNGGDGFVAARHLSDVCNVEVYLAKPEDKVRSNLARKALIQCKKAGVPVHVIGGMENLGEIIAKADIVLDAMLGIGVSGKLKEPYSDIISILNDSGKIIVSVDVPSGLGTDIWVVPCMTVTFHAVKEGMTKMNSGDIHVRDIGIPRDAEDYVGPGEFVYYPLPKKTAHKGDSGRLLVVGGGPYTGAPALVAMGAYAVGTDMVHILVPESIKNVVASYSPNFIVHSYPDGNLKELFSTMKRLQPGVEAMVIGPGLGSEKNMMAATSEIISNWWKPIVIDADAIHAAKGVLKDIAGKNVVVTPHRKEFKDLFGVNASKDNVMKIAAKHRVTILAKTVPNIITDGKNMKQNRTGNPGMTVGGTGDVLSGIVGALIARGMCPYNAARLGAFINGTAGDMAFEEKSYGLTAVDVAGKAPEVLRKYL